MPRELIVEENEYLHRTPQVDYLNVPVKRWRYGMGMQWQPTITGADTYRLPVPYHPSGLQIVWKVYRCTLVVGAAGGAPSLTLEYSNVPDGVNWVGLCDVFVTSGQVYAYSSAALPILSGGLLRANVTALGTATSWTMTVDLEEVPQ